MDDSANTADAPRVSVKSAAGLLVAITLAVTGFVVLSSVLGLAQSYMGFGLLWYWANIGKCNFAALPATLAGATGGILTSWLLQYLPTAIGTAGYVVPLLIIALVLFVGVLKISTTLFNGAYMLFVTFGCAPLLQSHEDFARALVAVFLASLFFGVLVYGARLINSLVKRRKSEEAGW